MRLRLARRGGRTAVVQRYSKTPFGAVRANYPDGSGTAEVQITNPSGGILGGDHLETEILVEPSARATILTQAANKAYKGTEALQNTTFRLGNDAFLEYLPHHLIPFARSRYRQETAFYLAKDARLITWDACSAGRVARGERFAFSALSGRTRILRENMPRIVDGFELSGGGEPFGGYSYMGTLYVVAPQNLSPLAEDLHALLVSVSGILASASSLDADICTARILARDATALYRALNACRTVARAYLDLPPPARDV